jgi:hypothetical protein
VLSNKNIVPVYALFQRLACVDLRYSSVLHVHMCAIVAVLVLAPIPRAFNIFSLPLLPSSTIFLAPHSLPPLSCIFPLSTSVLFQAHTYAYFSPPVPPVLFLPPMLPRTPLHAHLPAFVKCDCPCRISSSARQSWTAPTRSSTACQVRSRHYSKHIDLVYFCLYKSLGPRLSV